MTHTLDPIHVNELQALARGIKSRDEAAEKANSHWMATGLDLTRAKELVGHGGFAKWCRAELAYTIRTANRYMQAAEVFREAGFAGTDARIPDITDVLRIGGHTSDPEKRRELIELACTRDIAKREQLRSLLRRPVPKNKLILKRGDDNISEGAGARRKVLRVFQALVAPKLGELLDLCSTAGPGEVLNAELVEALRRFHRFACRRAKPFDTPSAFAMGEPPPILLLPSPAAEGPTVKA